MSAMAAQVLTTHRRALEEKGVLLREVMATSPPSVAYRLTNLGSELFQVIDAIVEVGHQLKTPATGKRQRTG